MQWLETTKLVKIMADSSDTPPVIAGFIEGVVAPILELVLSVVISASLKVSESLGGSPWYLIAIIAIVLIFDFVRNVVLGLSRTQFALGNVIGNIIGLFLFYAAISKISAEAATESVLLTIALSASYGFGVYLYLRSRS